MIIHKEDPLQAGYYLCIHACGKGDPKKLTSQWKKVTCRNCIERNRVKAMDLSI